MKFTVFMQTDGLGFDVETRFKGGVKGALWGAKVGAKSRVKVGRGEFVV